MIGESSGLRRFKRRLLLETTRGARFRKSLNYKQCKTYLHTKGIKIILERLAYQRAQPETDSRKINSLSRPHSTPTSSLIDIARFRVIHHPQ